VIFYTYLWLRTDGSPYYIGKGHGQRAYRKGCPSVEIVPDFISEPDSTRILVQEWPDEATAFAYERYQIDFWGRKDLGTGILRNFTDGGEGVSGIRFTQETRRRMSVSHLGQKMSEEFCKIDSESHKGLKHSLETRRKISENQKGKMITNTSRRKMSDSHKGLSPSMETREKMSRAQKGRVFSFKHRLALSLSRQKVARMEIQNANG